MILQKAKKSVMYVLTTLAVSCGTAGCDSFINTAPLHPRSPATIYPEPGPNMAARREQSLQNMLALSLEQQEEIDVIDFIPALTCKEQRHQCDQKCWDKSYINYCMNFCVQRYQWCQLDSIRYH